MAHQQADLVHFFEKADEVVKNTAMHQSDDAVYVQHMINRLAILDEAISSILATNEARDDDQYTPDTKARLCAYLQDTKAQKKHLDDKLAKLNQEQGCAFQVGSVPTGGRPKFNVTREQIERLSCLNFSWNQIADILGVSRITLWRRRKEFQISEKYDNISDRDIDNHVSQYRKDHPYTGEREMIGHLRGNHGIQVQRCRLRDSIKRMDPINTSLRWHDPIKRKPYSVPSPNSLWHIDSNLKLIRWGFVIHGGIDGYSRTITYLKSSLDNKAQTVFSLFREAEQIHGEPSRVRSDYGSENRMVGKYMLETRGLNRGSLITGSSIHNNRIERLWRDCGRSVITLFSRIFIFLENNGGDQTLDLGDPVCLFCLQYVFLPKINHALDEWTEAWNNHPMSTCGNLSPLQNREKGFLSRFGSSSRAVRKVFDKDVPSCLEEYGVDTVENHLKTEGSAQQDMPESSLQCPTVHLSVSNERALEILADVDPLARDGNFGIDTYKECVQLLRSNV